MKKTISIIALSVALCSCSSLENVAVHETGVRVSQNQMNQIKAGEMNQTDVLNILGYPSSKSTVGDVLVWNYEYKKIATFANNISERKVVEFDKTGKVLGVYNASASSSNALLEAAQ